MGVNAQKVKICTSTSFTNVTRGTWYMLRTGISHFPGSASGEEQLNTNQGLICFSSFADQIPREETIPTVKPAGVSKIPRLLSE